MAYPALSNNIISALVADQLPEFVTESYPNFVAFTEAYYEYLEQEGKLVNTIKNFPNYFNVDYVVENDMTDFVDYFQQTFMSAIPTNILVDKAKLIKHIKTFYSSRGTPKSFALLFRILFNEDVNLFLNTGTQVLKASAGNWYQPTVLRIVPVILSGIPLLGELFILGQSSLGTSQDELSYTDVSQWINVQVIGLTSKATAVVSNSQTNYQDGVQYNELTVSNITGNFLPNEEVQGTLLTGQVIIGRLLGVVTSIIIDTPGTSYNVGDPVIITGGGGSNANAIISQVSSGEITQISVIDGGAGYQLSPSFTITIGGSSNPATALVAAVNTASAMAPNNYIVNTDALANSNGSSYIVNSPHSWVSNSWNTVTYGNCGPITVIQVLNKGGGYPAPPQISVQETSTFSNSNIYITQLGMIGELVINNPGQNYSVNDDIKIISGLSRGVAAGGIVTSVNGSGAIVSIAMALPSISGTVGTTVGANTVTGIGTHFTTELVANNNSSYPGSGSYVNINGTIKRVMSIASDTSLTVDSNFPWNSSLVYARLEGFPIGGFGYLQSDLPASVSCIVQTQNGTGASITANSIVGAGATFRSTSGTFGQIEAITVDSYGSGYSSPPDIDLTHSGDGTATAHADLIQSQFQYPGYFLNEDGMLSSRRYLEDATNYNNYTYRITSPVAVGAYKDIVYNLLNPAGMNMQGITQIIGQTNATFDIIQSATNYITIGTFEAVESNGKIIYITSSTPYNDGMDIDFILDYSVLGGASPGQNVGVDFIVGASTVE